jgi:hypothetical protein
MGGRQPRAAAATPDRRPPRELVLDLSRTPPCRLALPARARLPAGRRRPRPQPRGRSRPGRVAAAVRVHLAPRLIAAAFRLSAVRRFLFRTVSQTAISYRGSSLSEGRAGAVHGGDRLPWVCQPDNFAPLQSLDWQVHVYGHATAELGLVCSARGLALHVFPWGEPASRGVCARRVLSHPSGWPRGVRRPRSRSGAAGALCRHARPPSRSQTGAGQPRR